MTPCNLLRLYNTNDPNVRHSYISKQYFVAFRCGTIPNMENISIDFIVLNTTFFTWTNHYRHLGNKTLFSGKAHYGLWQ